MCQQQQQPALCEYVQDNLIEFATLFAIKYHYTHTYIACDYCKLLKMQLQRHEPEFEICLPHCGQKLPFMTLWRLSLDLVCSFCFVYCNRYSFAFTILISFYLSTFDRDSFSPSVMT